MEFLILGPIEVHSAAGVVALGGNKPRAVLAVLLLHPNQPVSAERLALALWGEDAPGGAVKTVQVHVSRLRKALGDPEVLTTTRAGYTLLVHQGELDAERFEGLVEDARQAMADDLAEDAAVFLRQALALWRGPALAELDGEPFAVAEIARLHEQRLTALELRIDADLATGRHAEVVGELRQLVTDHPTREQLAAQLMLALYRCGRQTEALEAYADTRRTLVEEIGIEPGPQLRELHQAILRQDAALPAKPPTAELPAALDPANAHPLVGRDEELQALLACWHVARNSGGGGLVALTGPRGAGRSRLAVELARAIHRPDVTILHASGDGPADSILVALRRVREAIRPTLLVIDDADRAGASVHSELDRLAPALTDITVLVVVIAEEVRDLAHLHPTAVVELGPLDAEAVREIALGYASGGVEVQADRLLEASRGVPSRAHEVASQWARREAARQVGSIADRTQIGRAELRSIEAELAGGVAEFQERRTRIAAGDGGGDDGPVVCPFKGLATFDVADARYFYGRERLVAELVARLVGSPLLAIVGPSGSGKSSVMRAGLLPALSSGVLPGSERWSQLLIRPGRHPLREFADALAEVDADGRVVLAVDQFEETFTVCSDEAERAEFVAELVRAATESRGRFVVVIALRADHYGRCAAYSELSAPLAESNVLVGTMRADELRRAIEEPCRQAGLRIEPELVDALVADIEHEPGGLPLLSAALLELWQRRDGRRLRHREYAQTGGVRGAVARLAEDAFAQLDEPQRAAGRTVLMRLVGGGEGDAVERRRVALDELEIERDADLARAVALLTDRRLLTVSAGGVELAHEALLREWPRLRGWIDEDRDGLRIHRALGIAAEEWERLDRDPGSLYRGARLSEAREWRDGRDRAINELERAFLRACEAESDRERSTRRRRVTLVLAALSVGFVAALGAAIFADRERQIATSRELAAKSAAVLGIDPGVALEVARQALDRHDTDEAKHALRQAALEDRATTVVRASKAETMSVAASPDGSMVVSGGDDGKVRLWRAQGLHAVRTLTTHARGATSVAVSPDGRSVASAGRDGSISLTPIAGGPARKLRPLPVGDEQVYRVVTAGGVVIAGTTAGSVWIFRPAGGATGRVLGRHPGRGKVVVAISPDAKTVFSADAEGVGFLWDVRTGARTSVPLRGEVAAASFRPDGKRVVVVGPKGRVRILDAATGAKVSDLEMGDRLLFSVDFSRDGRRIVTAADDHVLQIKDVENGQELNAMAGGNAERAVFTAGGRVVSADADGTLRAWAPLEVKTPRDHATVDPFTFPSFSRDGRMVASGDFGGPVHVWDLAGRERTLAGDEPGAAVAAAFSPDGSLVASAGTSVAGPVRVYDVKAGRSRVLRFPAFGKYAIAMAAPARVAVAGDKHGGGFPILLMDVDGTHPQRLTGHTDWVDALAFDSSGRHLVSGSFDGTARIWDLATGKLVRTIRADAQTVRWVAYSPDGTRVATAGADGTIRIWPVRGGDPVVLVGHEGPVNTAVFNHRGDRIVSTGVDGTVRVWDAAGGDTLVVLVRRRGTDGAGAAFSPDDSEVVSSDADGLRITRCEACGSFADAERLAGTRAPRPLDPAERKRLGLHD